eukprot:scaffold149125_cov22-Tisochrysis_lutea.AAC.1
MCPHVNHVHLLSPHIKLVAVCPGGDGRFVHNSGWGKKGQAKQQRGPRGLLGAFFSEHQTLATHPPTPLSYCVPLTAGLRTPSRTTFLLCLRRTRCVLCHNCVLSDVPIGALCASFDCALCHPKVSSLCGAPFKDRGRHNQGPLRSYSRSPQVLSHDIVVVYENDEACV